MPKRTIGLKAGFISCQWPAIANIKEMKIGHKTHLCLEGKPQNNFKKLSFFLKKKEIFS